MTLVKKKTTVITALVHLEGVVPLGVIQGRFEDAGLPLKGIGVEYVDLEE